MSNIVYIYIRQNTINEVNCLLIFTNRYFIQVVELATLGSFKYINWLVFFFIIFHFKADFFVSFFINVSINRKHVNRVSESSFDAPLSGCFSNMRGRSSVPDQSNPLTEIVNTVLVGIFLYYTY